MRLFVKNLSGMSGSQLLRVMENLRLLAGFFDGEGVESITAEAEDTGGNRREEVYDLIGEGGKTLALRCASEMGEGFLKIEPDGNEQKMEGSIEFI